ncbi:MULTISPECIES: MAE_28990/MAE_18760 family HEPN-like nuclease [Delftia]|uniref:MAE-28990/MAE-18760-like HEPN domain-containing protein n=1 Tax=Delftia lacustris TaxID=558537 RepID=A0A1H3S705_9BURK|nr:MULTISPECIES: MAE_28990/MAE_18760 family HEPN-like nuclease [Delftia]EPD37779.1 hypothetical protein HMPREF9702_04860 [Delftia acidovorans CCUG 15835]QPS83862.1 hypothetical protein I6G47_12710 [Delftia lacustris]SDZ33816.1 hypothetical protein SAMN05421547_118105 [Delftia lacustris]
MKIRSTEDLTNYLDDDLAWRRKEIIELRVMAKSAKAKKADVHVRAGVAMLYAHWEGFIKNASNAYVVFVSARGMKTRDLQDSFIALSIKTKLSLMGDSGKSSVAVPAITHLMSLLDKPALLPVTGITAEGNLKSDVFVNIAGWLGIDVARYSSRFNLIDETLLASRNRIAHGEYLSISTQRFETLAEEILELMMWFKTDLENAAALKSFQRIDSTLPALATSVT